MNIYQCEKKAQAMMCDNVKFLAMFPIGPIECTWIDAFMGLVQVDADGLRDGFLTVGQIDEQFPNLVCSEPYVYDKMED